MAASINDLITAVMNGGAPVPTTVSSIRTPGATTLSCVALTHWPVISAVHFVTGTPMTDAEGNAVINPTSLALWKAIVSGTTLTGLVLEASATGSDPGNSVNDIVQMAPDSAWAQDLFTALTNEHTTQGKHTTGMTVGGNPTNLLTGWVSIIATLSYSSWSSTTLQGILNSTADLTGLCQPGDRLTISQPTGGVKYGIIVAVSSSQLTVFFGNNYTLTNETITLPAFSKVKNPQGFNNDPALWTLTNASTTEQIIGSPTSQQWYNPGSQSLPLGVGVWNTQYFVQCGCSATTAGRVDSSATLSTSNSAASDSDLIGTFGIGNVTYHSEHFSRGKSLTLTTAGNIYLLGRADQPSMTNLYFENQVNIGSTGIIRATSAYL